MSQFSVTMAMLVYDVITQTQYLISLIQHRYILYSTEDLVNETEDVHGGYLDHDLRMKSYIPTATVNM